MNRNIARQVADERGVDIRQPSTALLGVSSQDRFKTYDRSENRSGPYEITLTSGQNFMNGSFTRVALTEVVFTWAIPTITARNNKIGLKWSATGDENAVVNYVITIPEADAGWYSTASLAAKIQDLVVAKALEDPSFLGFTCIYNPATNGFKAQAAGIATFAFVPINVGVQSLGAGTAAVTKSQPDRIQLFDMMNWNPAGTTAGKYTLAGTQYSGVPSLLSTKFVDIVSDSLTYSQEVRDGDTGKQPRDVVARIYLQGQDALNPENLGDQPFVVYRNYTLPKQIKWSSILPIGELSFRLYDDQGYILSTLQYDATKAYLNDEAMPNWNMTLLVTEV